MIINVANGDVMPTKEETEERKEKIFALIKQGLSYTQIAELMGVTKNAISGFVYRDREKVPIKLDPTVAWVKKRKHKINLDMLVNADGITIFELKETTCRYMIGDHRYCGQIVAKIAYCQKHADDCYVIPKKRWR